MNNFRLTIMGTASAMPVVGRYQSAHILEICGRFFLIDCGEGAQKQMFRYGISPMKLDAIFISHIHGDHIYGLMPLLSTMGMSGRTAPLHIYGPTAVGPILKFFMSFFGYGMPFEPVFHDVSAKQPEVIYETKKLTVSAFPLSHGIETYGYLFREVEPQFNIRKEAVERYGFTKTEIGMLKRGEDIIRPAGPDEPVSFLNGFVKNSGSDEPLLIKNEDVAYKPYDGRSYAYCSDTAPFPELAGWVKNVDILYHECTYLTEFADKAEERLHSTTIQAAKCALEAQAKKLVVGHYSSRCQDIELYQKECRTIFPETYASSEGDVFDVPCK